jgi:lysophospholipase L1-like esterase
MIKVINDLKSTFPQTSILLIGVGDKSIKKGTKFVTDPRVSELNKLQLDIVAKTGIAFWDFFQAMGGYNSMVTWVHTNPPLGAFDYEHPTDLGAEKIGHMIAKALIDAYSNSK